MHRVAPPSPNYVTAGEAARSVLLALVAKQDDLGEREAWLQIMRKDGHLPARGGAA